MAERVLQGPSGLEPEIPEVKSDRISPAKSCGSLPHRAAPAAPHRRPGSVRSSLVRNVFGCPLSTPH